MLKSKKTKDQSPLPISRLTGSRRSFLSQTFRTGATAATFAAFPLATGKLLAQEAPSCDDIGVLNYALTLEHLEAAFYVQGLQRFNARSFGTGGFISHLGPRVAGQLHDYLELIRDHEVAHVQTLISVIQSLGGTPVGPCTYDFGYRTAEDFLKVAQALENTGVMAYDGAIASICSPDLQTAGATIATVEARHASYLNLVNGDVPFPAAFDTPKTKSEILAIAGQFIVSCP